MCIVSTPRSPDPGGDQRSPGTILRDEFLRDHQILTHGFQDLIEALDRHDDTRATEIAERIDRVAGPHIDFEEHEYYPTLRAWLGDAAVEEMYDEHQVGLSAVRSLAFRPASMPLPPGERTRLIEDARIALDHAVACGAALSHLDSLDEARQRTLLDSLIAKRKQGRRWSELERYAARND